MKHTLHFAVVHPRYYHTMIVRRLGPGRWECELIAADPAMYERKVLTRAGVRLAAQILRATALIEQGRRVKDVR